MLLGLYELLLFIVVERYHYFVGNGNLNCSIS